MVNTRFILGAFTLLIVLGLGVAVGYSLNITGPINRCVAACNQELKNCWGENVGAIERDYQAEMLLNKSIPRG